MKNNGRYEVMIRELPWENGGRDMAPQIIAAAGIRKKQERSTHRARDWCRQFSPAIISLTLAMLLLAYGWDSSQNLKGQPIGSNTLALWTQTAEGFRCILDK